MGEASTEYRARRSPRPLVCGCPGGCPRALVGRAATMELKPGDASKPGMGSCVPRFGTASSR
eukprot:5155910-Prorocentrum_lima.AAC.1